MLTDTELLLLQQISAEIRWAGVLQAAATYYSMAEVTPEEIVHLARRLDDARPKGGAS